MNEQQIARCWVLAALALAGCASAKDGDAGSGTGASGRVTCVSGQGSLGETGDIQVFRLEVELGVSETVAIERGAVSLFAQDEETARHYASEDLATLGRLVLEREVLAELADDGLQMTWSDGELSVEPSSQDGLFEGEASFDGDAREVVCWRSDLELRFRYDADSGECRDEDGELGMNELPDLYVHETGNAECNDFGEGEISTLGWPIYAGWNCRGADLSEASLHFALMPDADFSGARLSMLATGYLNANGLRDEHTELDEPIIDAGDGTLHFGDIGVRVADQTAYYPWRTTCSAWPLAAHCVDLE